MSLPRSPFHRSFKTYTADYEGEAKSVYVDDRHNPKHHWQVDYKFELSGAHTGEPIQVWMLNVSEDCDEGGRHATWERLVWADDETPFDATDGYLHDAYTDNLRDHLNEIARETWD